MSIIKKYFIVGSFFRIDKKVNNDFTRNCKDSEIKKIEGQSKRDLVVQDLMEQYNNKGDKILKNK